MITVHKLKYRSLDYIFASEWNYGANWMYILLSKLKTSAGIYLRDNLLHKSVNLYLENAKSSYQSIREITKNRH